MLIRRVTFNAALKEAHDNGRDEERSKPTVVHVAGAHGQVRDEAMRRATAPNGEVRRAHSVTHVKDLVGFYGGVLLCGYGTPRCIEVEAQMRGMTLIKIGER